MFVNENVLYTHTPCLPDTCYCVPLGSAHAEHPALSVCHCCFEPVRHILVFREQYVCCREISYNHRSFSITRLTDKFDIRHISYSTNDHTPPPQSTLCLREVWTSDFLHNVKCVNSERRYCEVRTEGASTNRALMRSDHTKRCHGNYACTT
jgi:hypothetical protein